MDAKTSSNQIIKALMAVHRSLLHYQKEIQEIFDGRKYTPHETLHLAINNAEFEWLKILSNIIIGVDEALDEKEASPELVLIETKQELNEIFNIQDQHTEFKRRLEIAMRKDLVLCEQVAQLRTLL